MYVKSRRHGVSRKRGVCLSVPDLVVVVVVKRKQPASLVFGVGSWSVRLLGAKAGDFWAATFLLEKAEIWRV